MWRVGTAVLELVRCLTFERYAPPATACRCLGESAGAEAVEAVRSGRLADAAKSHQSQRTTESASSRKRSRKTSSAQVRRGVHQEDARPESQRSIALLAALAADGEHWSATVDDEAVCDRMRDAESARCRDALK